jgi:hypothetical protein
LPAVSNAHIRGTTKPGVTRDDLSQPVYSGAWGAEKELLDIASNAAGDIVEIRSALVEIR